MTTSTSPLRATHTAAREEFAAHGHDGATIRAIAARAQVDPSLVMQHDGSKAALSSSVIPWDSASDQGLDDHLRAVLDKRLAGLPPEMDGLVCSMLTVPEATARALTAAGLTTRDAAVLTGVSRAAAGRPASSSSSRPAPRPVPANRLSAAERARVLDVLNRAEFVDCTPLQIYVTLQRGTHLCSVSSMYRVLAEHAQVKARRRLARHPARVRPELVATGPGQVISWDFTKLRGPNKGDYFDAYVMIDIYSRYIVGACVHAGETAVLAEQMMREVFAIHGTPQVVHADRGTSMTSKTVAALLSDLDVTRSHSRPRVSNDNPFSEAWFKTLKYAPVFPDRVGTLPHARSFLDEFVSSYNHQHHHTGIGLHTPADVHYGLNDAVTDRRVQALAAAAQQTRTDSAPASTPRSSTCPRPPGSPHPSPRPKIKNSSPQPKPHNSR